MLNYQRAFVIENHQWTNRSSIWPEIRFDLKRHQFRPMGWKKVGMAWVYNPQYELDVYIYIYIYTIINIITLLSLLYSTKPPFLLGNSQFTITQQHLLKNRRADQPWSLVVKGAHPSVNQPQPTSRKRTSIITLPSSGVTIYTLRYYI